MPVRVATPSTSFHDANTLGEDSDTGAGSHVDGRAVNQHAEHWSCDLDRVVQMDKDDPARAVLLGTLLVEAVREMQIDAKGNLKIFGFFNFEAEAESVNPELWHIIEGASKHALPAITLPQRPGRKRSTKDSWVAVWTIGSISGEKAVRQNLWYPRENSLQNGLFDELRAYAKSLKNEYPLLPQHELLDKALQYIKPLMFEDRLAHPHATPKSTLPKKVVERAREWLKEGEEVFQYEDRLGKASSRTVHKGYGPDDAYELEQHGLGKTQGGQLTYSALLHHRKAISLPSQYLDKIDASCEPEDSHAQNSLSSRAQVPDLTQTSNMFHLSLDGTATHARSRFEGSDVLMVDRTPSSVDTVSSHPSQAEESTASTTSSPTLGSPLPSDSSVDADSDSEDSDDTSGACNDSSESPPLVKTHQPQSLAAAKPQRKRGLSSGLKDGWKQRRTRARQAARITTPFQLGIETLKILADKIHYRPWESMAKVEDILAPLHTITLANEETDDRRAKGTPFRENFGRMVKEYTGNAENVHAAVVDEAVESCDL